MQMVQKLLELFKLNIIKKTSCSCLLCSKIADVIKFIYIFAGFENL